TRSQAPPLQLPTTQFLTAAKPTTPAADSSVPDLPWPTGPAHSFRRKGEFVHQVTVVPADGVHQRADDQRGNSMMRTTRRGPRTVLAMTTTAALTAGLLAGAALPAGAAVPEPDLHYTMED